MHRLWQRPVLTLLASVALAASGAVALATPAQAADTDIKINEVESNGGTPGDWIELINTGAARSTSAGSASSTTTTATPWSRSPAGTMLGPGAFYVFDDASVSFGLGGADSARLYAADGTTLLDTYSWTSHAATHLRPLPGRDRRASPTTTHHPGRGQRLRRRRRPRSRSTRSSPTAVRRATGSSSSTTGAAPVDVVGLVLKDNNDTHAFTIPPAARRSPAGGYLAVDVSRRSASASGDSARLFVTDGTHARSTATPGPTHATTTYGRCPDGTGAFTTTAVVTKGAANACAGDIVADAVAGRHDGQHRRRAERLGAQPERPAYEGTGTATPGMLWAVQNGSGTLYKLVQNGADVGAGHRTAGPRARRCTTRTAPEPGRRGRDLHRRRSGRRRLRRHRAQQRRQQRQPARDPALRPDAAGTSLNATNEWNLTADLPALGANIGLEAITWVPDSYLTAQGLQRQDGGAAYNPADYPNHGTGLFFVGVEQNGMVYAYALDLTSNGFTRVASFASGFPAVMELHFEPETQKLWVVCDDTCHGRTRALRRRDCGRRHQGRSSRRSTTSALGHGQPQQRGLRHPPRSECVGGVKPVFWADDGNTGGNALRSGTLSCTNPAAQTVTFSTTAPAGPVVGQTYTPAASGGGSGNPVVISLAAGSASVCSLTAGVVTFSHPGSCVVTADQAGNDDFAPGSAQQAITVLKANTKTTTKPKATTIDATVAVLAPGVGSPTGTVLFAVDGTNVGSAPLSGGTASLTYTVPHDGASHDVTAAYQGDADFTGSASLVTRADPTITASLSAQGEGASAAGWWHTPVTVSFTCTPQGSPLTGGCPGPVTLATSGADQSVVRTINADDGGTATVTVSGLDIDLDGPTVTIKGVKAGKTYPKKRKPTCQGTDALSGLGTCTVTQAKSGKKYVVTATATDLAGNVTTATLTYKVQKPKKG